MKDIFKNDDTYLARWLNGALSEKELEEFKNSEDYQLFNRIADKSSNLSTEDWQKDQIWTQIKKEGGIAQPSTTSKPKVIRLGWTKYAAAVVIIAVIGYLALFRGDRLQTVQTYAAETKVIDLPDGSKAFLNAESLIQYNPESFLADRNMTMEGEVFFEVEEGSKFTVNTENGDVRVLGTSFNVRSRTKKLDVACYSGRVGVSFDNFENERALSKGDRVVAESGRIIANLSIEGELNRPEWRDGSTKFINASMDEVINELERQFDIQFETDSSIREIKNYNGGFDHNDLNAALEVVFTPIQYNYKVEGKRVILSKKS
ncbi:MAG: FecR domain-containing protein [Bacteroidota bacterium]